MDQHIGHRVRILHWCIDQAMTGALAQMDLTAAQGLILGYLAHASLPPCPRDIEDTFHLSHPTVSGLLRRLEKKGFIAFQADPEDRRCKRIYMLPKGQQCTDAIYQRILENENRIISNFSPEEKTLFLDLMNRAIANMGCNPDKEDFNK